MDLSQLNLRCLAASGRTINTRQNKTKQLRDLLAFLEDQQCWTS